MHLNASSGIPGGITGPGTIRWLRERERERNECVQHSLLVFTSRAACLSRFALIKDKSSLIGCRCAALMSITPLHTDTHTLSSLQNAPQMRICTYVIRCTITPPPPIFCLSLIHVCMHAYTHTPHTLCTWGTSITSEHSLSVKMLFLYWSSFPGWMNPTKLWGTLVWERSRMWKTELGVCLWTFAFPLFRAWCAKGMAWWRWLWFGQETWRGTCDVLY